ncbi:MAG TPA: Ig-like domain-containing protein [Candidatus Acidoferrum sp.]|nr:Ig-like domain-containing protein [Candidatus Acidoferrum sp.]
MKKLHLTGAVAGILVSLGLLIAQCSSAQVSTYPTPTNISIPVVTIKATVPLATWSGSPGVFTVFRSGNPAPPLHVYYDIGGTAVDGVDYKFIGHYVDIPSGVLCADVTIYPTNRMANPVLTNKTVILTLTNSPLLAPTDGAMPVNYAIGSPSSATVTIVSGPISNVPPAVTLVYPKDGDVFWTPVNIPLVACARDYDGSVTQVQFFADNVSLGVVTNPLSVLPAMSTAVPAMPLMPPYRPYVLLWSNAPVGPHTLTAIATDNDGASTTSDPVQILVNKGPPPPPTNVPPIVRITSPANGAAFHQPLNLPIFAFAVDVDGFVTNVQFFAGTNNLGAGHPIHAVPPPLPPGPIQPPILIAVPSNFWAIVWSNAPIGDYPLTAVATDNRGASTVSDPVNITILPPVPPPTPTNLVSILATDPIAIAGTNCWPWVAPAAASPSWSNWNAASTVFRYFTNCGPKDAIFTVRRLGDTNSAVDVTYAIGGTASNGVDYVAVPGDVTIPVGSRDALITIVPIDNGQSPGVKTVILKLAGGTGYWVDPHHASAEAVILEGHILPPVATGLLPDGSFLLSSTGPEGAFVRFEASSDLLNWTPICTNQVFGGVSDAVDPDAATAPVKFYRAVHDADAPQ